MNDFDKDKVLNYSVLGNSLSIINEGNVDFRRYYEILELDADASFDDINQAYRDLVAVWHPDRFNKNTRLKLKAEKKLKEINEAYDKIIGFSPSKTNLHHIEIKKDQSSSAVQQENLTTTFDDKNISRSSQGGSHRFPSKATTAPTFQVHPWLRFTSRLVDYFFLGLFIRLSGFPLLLPENYFYLLLLSMGFVLSWVIPEAIFLSLLGTTPGKFLLNTHVKDIFQLKPKFGSSLRRSLSVWCNGMGMGVPFIFPMTMAIAYFRLKRGKTPWDRDGGFSIVHRPITAGRKLAAVLLMALAGVLMFLGPDMVTETFKQVVKLVPESPKAHYSLGASYAEHGRCDEAIKSYKQALKFRHDYPEALYGLGVCYTMLNRYNEAVDPLKNFVQIHGDHAMGNYYLGLCYFKLFLYEDAIKSLKASIEAYGDYAPAHYNLGLCYMALEKYDEAFESLKQALMLDPDDINTSYNLGKTQSKLQRNEDAIKTLKQVLQQNPDYTPAYHDLGSLFFKLGNYREALGAYEQAIRINTKDVEAFYGSGICSAKLGLTDQAIKRLKTAIQVNPGYAPAYHILGLTYLSLENKNAAVKQYEILKTLNKSLSDELFYYIENLQVGDQ